jgi:hypothetical protein
LVDTQAQDRGTKKMGLITGVNEQGEKFVVLRLGSRANGAAICLKGKPSAALLAEADLSRPHKLPESWEREAQAGEDY